MSYISDQAAAGEGRGFDIPFVRDKLTEAGFVAHRRHIEQERPLEEDLLSLRIDLLPDYLRRWQKAKDAFDRIEVESAAAAAGEEEPGQVDRVAGISGTVNRADIQLLLGDAGEIATRLWLEQELSFASRRALVLCDVIEERRKRNRLASSQAFSRTAACDAERIYRSSWLSWFMSGRERETYISGIESALIRAKIGFARALRNFGALVGDAADLLERLAQRGLISSVLLEPLKESDARATARVAVGDVEDEGSGFFLSLRFLHKANASSDFTVEKLAPGTGLAVTLDLEARDEASDEELDLGLEAVSKVLRAHVLPELKRGGVFHSMRGERGLDLPKAKAGASPHGPRPGVQRIVFLPPFPGRNPRRPNGGAERLPKGFALC